MKTCDECFGVKSVCTLGRLCPWLKIPNACDSCYALEDCPECKGEGEIDE